MKRNLGIQYYKKSASARGCEGIGQVFVAGRTVGGVLRKHGLELLLVAENETGIRVLVIQLMIADGGVQGYSLAGDGCEQVFPCPERVGGMDIAPVGHVAAENYK